ncbi:MAG: hypothetical protein R6X31_12430 [Anaerolineae bacterium]
MSVYRLTRADRNLLWAGADLEAVLAEREKEKLERSERTGERLSADTLPRLGHQGAGSGKARYARSMPEPA